MRLAVIAIAIVAVIAGLVYFGVLSKAEVETTGRKTVTDVKNLGAKVVSPLEGTSPQAAQTARQCQDLLKRIESAKRAIADSTGRAVGAISWDEVLRHMSLSKAPTCPGGGTYSLNNLGIAATCSIGGNGTTDRSDDHTIQSF